MSYANIIDFGKAAGRSHQNDPLTYCVLSPLDSGFYHTLGGVGLLGPDSSQCQRYTAQYCASQGWNGVCELLSQDPSTIYPDVMGTPGGYNTMSLSTGIGNGMSKGQILIRNTASEKYLKSISGNCVKDYQPFDPTVPNSPLVYQWKQLDDKYNYSCTPIYDIQDAKTIDDDVVMNKLLAQPWIALDILTNIYKTRVREGTMEELEGTKLGNFFKSAVFKQNLPNARFLQTVSQVY
jgi:hypothetical protein